MCLNGVWIAHSSKGFIMSYRAKALEAFRKAGYSGAEDAKSIQDWITENNVSTNFDAKKFDAKTVTISVSADAGEDVQVMSDDAEDAMDPADAGEDMAPKSLTAAQIADIEANAVRKFQASRRGNPGAVARVNATTVTGGEPAFIKSMKDAYNRKAKYGKTVFADATDAMVFQASVRQAISKGIYQFADYKFRDMDNTILKVAVGNIDTSGGALVPQGYLPSLINLVDKFGAARQLAGVVTMSQDTLAIPRVAGRLTAYWQGENTAATATDLTLNLVNLSAKKLMALNYVTTELMNDSALSYTDIIATDFARAIAQAEDQAYFLGDGTDTYGNIRGIGPSFRAVLTAAGGSWATNAGNLAGVVVADGDTFSEVTLNNLTSLVSRIPQYALQGGNCQWVMSNAAYDAIVSRLALTPASSGQSIEMVNGVPQRTLLGFPVYFTPVMPQTDAVSQFVAFFGDFAAGSKLGDRQKITLATSTDFKFDSDLIAMRATCRLDINVHDVGNYSATASSRVAGPIVGLLSAAS